MGKSRRERRAERAQTSIALAEAPSNVVPIARASPEVGISGTVSHVGRMRTEANAKLQWEQAYGVPGSTTWGAWETLERTDHAVASALNLIAAPLRDATVEIEAVDESELQVAIADFIRDNLCEWLEPRWPTLIEQMVRYGPGYGFSLHELVLGTRPDKRVPSGHAVYLRKLAHRLPSSIRSDGWLEKDGELYGIKQAGIRDGKWVEIVLPADKVLLATWNRTGTNFAGFSAFRPIWYLAQMRANLLRILAIGHEREALGVPVAIPAADSNLDKIQLDALQAALEGLTAHENAAYVLPKGVDFKWVFSPGANKGNVLETWNALGTAILETVQAQQTALGNSATGNRALGEVHDASKNAFVEGIRAWLEGAFNGVGAQPYTGVVRKLVELNFGPQEKYPVLRLVSKKAQLGLSELATAVKTLSDAGALMLTEADEAHLRERAGLPAIDPAARAELLAQKETARAEMVAAMKAKGEPEDEEETAEKPPTKFADARADVFTPARPLRPTEQHLDLVEIDSFHTRGRLDFERDVKAICREMLRGALPSVREAMKDGDPSELAGLVLDSKLLAKHVESFVQRARLYGYRTAELERRRQPAGLLAKRAAGEPGIKPIAFAERMSRVLALASAEEEDDKAPGSDPDTDGSEYAPAPVDKLVKAQTQLVVNRIKNRLKQQVQDYAIDVARAGGSAERVIDGVTEDVEESKTLRGDAGLVIARSFSMGREQFFEAHGEDIASMEYSAVLDPNTCLECAALDGREVEFGSAEHDAITPPYAQCRGGANCRCILIAQWKSGGGFKTVKE